MDPTKKEKKTATMEWTNSVHALRADLARKAESWTHIEAKIREEVPEAPDPRENDNTVQWHEVTVSDEALDDRPIPPFLCVCGRHYFTDTGTSFTPGEEGKRELIMAPTHGVDWDSIRNFEVPESSKNRTHE